MATFKPPNMTSSLPQTGAASPNPRRCLARDSVSLRHSTSELDPVTMGKTSTSAPTASNLLNRNGSPANSSNSQTWFDKSNNNPAPRNASTIDHDPPFFLSDSSSATPHNALSVANPAPFPAGPWRPEGIEGTLEDFRSVIDDLTVQNKKLQKRLRRYEKDSEDTMHSQRLFEVKFHALPANKKLELEETLKRFALSLNQSSSGNGSSNASQMDAMQRSSSALKASSFMSTKFADSGYGSLNTSHPTTVPRHSTNSTTTSGPTFGVEATRARDRSIRSYLHDIPEGLLPQSHLSMMTEENKKRLIVARLETLFQGSGAATEGHQQPIQQQEVSQLAAKAERTALEARGQRALAEGTREAQILDQSSDPSVGPAPKVPSAGVVDGGSTKSSATNPPRLIEQRPTRPLDLDPHRAQDATQNIGYIRHLGFNVLGHASTSTSDQGWIYLNILTNMAQLHTLNVTADLVTDALRSYSNKFELSSDGRMIRWHPSAGQAGEGTLQGSDEETATTTPERLGALDFRNDRSAIVGQKRPRPQYLDAPQWTYSSGKRTPMRPSTVRASSSLASSKTTLPSHPTIHSADVGPEEASDVDRDDSDVLLPSAAEYNSSPDHLASLDAAMSQSSLVKQEGALIFYNNPKFFLDMSGDHSRQPHAYGAASGTVANSQPLGIHSKPRIPIEEAFDAHSMAAAPSLSGSLEVNTDSALSEGYNRDLNEDSQNKAAAGGTPIPLELEASGIGYVYPSDNFVFFVQRDCGPRVSFKDLPQSKSLIPRRDPSAPPPSKRAKIVSVERRDLTPSRLPPAGFAYSPDDFEEESDEEEDEMNVDGDVSTSEESESKNSYEPEEDGDMDGRSSLGASFSSSQPERFSQSPSSQERTAAWSSRVDTTPEDNDAEDTQSIDFLATAREIDPAATRAREREYDAQLAERLADEIPAGSSAATRGGGSGNNSPVRATHMHHVVGADGEEEEDEGAEPGSVSS